MRQSTGWTKRGRRGSGPPTTDADLRAHVGTWPRRELITFALERILADGAVRRTIEERVAVGRAAAAATGLLREIHALFDERGPARRGAFGRRLRGLIGEVARLGQWHPACALEVALHVAEELSGVGAPASAWDALATLVPELALRASADPVGVATRLLDVSLADASPRTRSLPAVGGTLCRRKDHRVAYALALRQRAARLRGAVAERLRRLAARLVRARRT